MTDLLKRPDVMRAVELYALNPEITASEIAKELNVSTTMIYNWRKKSKLCRCYIRKVYGRVWFRTACCFECYDTRG